MSATKNTENTHNNMHVHPQKAEALIQQAITELKKNNIAFPAADGKWNKALQKTQELIITEYDKRVEKTVSNLEKLGIWIQKVENHDKQNAQNLSLGSSNAQTTTSIC